MNFRIRVEGLELRQQPYAASAGRLDPAVGVLGEHDGVVISVPIAVELGDHDVQGLSPRAAASRTGAATCAG